jgi:hypothetical protein
LAASGCPKIPKTPHMTVFAGGPKPDEPGLVSG